MLKLKIIFLLLFATTSLQSQNWSARLNGSANFHDAAYSIDVDASQNVYVCGEIVNLVTSNDFIVMKYNSAGVQQWTVLKNGDNYSDRATSLVVDENSNVYVCGYLHNSFTSNDAWIYKYNTSGAQQWAISVVGLGGSEDKANYITKDELGNIYVCGYTVNNSLNDEDVLTMKITTSGSVLWQRTYNSISSRRDQGTHLFVDGSGNVYVTGRSSPSPTNDYNYITLKYNSSGTLQWSAIYNGTGNSYDEASSVTADNMGNCYVTGKSWGAVNYDMTTIKYNSSGAQQWVIRYTSPSIGTTIKMNNDSNPIVCGYTSPGASDFIVIKYNTSGGQIWQSSYNDPLNQANLANKMEIDFEGNIVVAGNDYDARIVKFSSNGTLMGMISYDYGISGGENLYGLKLDAVGNVYVTGGSYGGVVTLTDILTMKYSVTNLPVVLSFFNSNVNENKVFLKWQTVEEINNSGFEIQRKKITDNNDCWSRVGFVQGHGTINIPQTYCFNETIHSVGGYNYRLKQIDYNSNFEFYNLNSDVIIGRPVSSFLHQNYPNPSNPLTKIDYQMNKPGNIKISVYDIAGKEITVLVKEFKDAGYYSVTFDGSYHSTGVYFYKIKTDDFSETRKMILVK